MAQSDLNVRLGLELRNFERGLKQAERALRRTAQSLQSLGSDISVAVTTPILAAGGASLKAAAEFEQLRNALIAVAGDADIAEEQLGRLRKIAEAPGVGFEQAVKASLQLQGLGFSAEQAENAITQVANAVAASGGGAEAFSGVVRQLGQIQAKNKVLQEDIGILLENAPILGQRLQEAFGARTAEQIAALGVNGEEFVQRLVGNLEQLERVQGGLANSFENFGIAVRFALADVGQQINELFNVQGIVDGFVRAIGDAVDVFRNLDDETKKSIVRFAGFAAAVGPTIFILGRLGGVVSTLIGFNRALTTFLVGNAGKFAVYTGAATTAEVATKRLNLALKLSFAGIALAAVGFLVGKFLEYRSAIKASSSELASATTAAGAWADVNRDASSSIAAQVAQVSQLVEVAQDETAAQNKRAEAIEKLRGQYPSYFGNVSADIARTGELTVAKEGLIASLLQEAKARAAANKITELAAKGLEIDTQVAEKKKEQAVLGRELAKLGFDNLGDAVKQLDANRSIAASLAAQGKIIPDNIRKLAEVVGAYQRAGIEANALQAEVIALTRVQEELAQVANSGSGATLGAPVITPSAIAAPSGDTGKQVAEKYILPINLAIAKLVRENQLPRLFEDTEAAAIGFADQSKVALAQLEEFQPTGFQAVATSLDNIRASLSSIGGTDLEIATAQVNALKQAVQEAALNADVSAESLGALQEQLAAKSDELGFLETLKGIEGVLDSITEQFGKTFSDAISEGQNALAAFGTAASEVLAKLLKDLLAAVVQALALSVLFSVFGLGPAGAGFGSIFKGIFFGRFAEGGVVPPGFPNDSYPALLTSGEVVVPPGKLPSIAGGAGGELSGTVYLDGNQLAIAMERFNHNRTRRRGI